MRHRLIFPGFARLHEGSTGWYIAVKMGQQEFSFFCGEKPPLNSSQVKIILEYQVPDAEPSPTPVV